MQLKERHGNYRDVLVLQGGENHHKHKPTTKEYKTTTE